MTTGSAEQAVRGHVFNADAWLDTHFEACRDEYEALLRVAGFQPGDTVLDAGFGTGSFLPLLEEIVGPRGRVLGCELSKDKATLAGHSRTQVWAGGLLDLPLAGACLDGVWCANVLQFLEDDDLLRALSEFRRVLRPGGLAAIKDMDMLAFHFSPADPFLMSHLSEAGWCDRQSPAEARGSLRGRGLKRWLQRAGFVEVQQRSVVIERWAPLSEPERALWAEWLSHLAELAQQRGVPQPDLESWRAIAAGDAIPFVSQPDFYGCELQVLATGRVSGAR